MKCKDGTEPTDHFEIAGKKLSINNGSTQFLKPSAFETHGFSVSSQKNVWYIKQPNYLFTIRLFSTAWTVVTLVNIKILAGFVYNRMRTPLGIIYDHCISLCIP